MKIIGAVVVAISIAIGIYAFNLDTSVYSDTGQKVNNLGLMNRQQNIVIISGFLFVGGILTLLLGGKK